MTSSSNNNTLTTSNLSSVVEHIQCPNLICQRVNRVTEIIQRDGRCKRCNRFIDPIRDLNERIMNLEREILALKRMPRNQRDEEYLDIFKRKLGEERMERRRLLAGRKPNPELASPSPAGGGAGGNIPRRTRTSSGL